MLKVVSLKLLAVLSPFFQAAKAEAKKAKAAAANAAKKARRAQRAAEEEAA